MSLTRIVFSTAVKIASELRQSSLRGYGNRRFGVTAIVASGLRQSPLRGYDKHSCSDATKLCALMLEA
ncbi:hypothetical protein [Prevotella nigrescens]|uniref:hypothetical protein n=1 Tax=Prevotella nigrescens TaxID=28133 RepID=UPI0011C07543|nr:hypothetical protein [Prevotella nigrescens]UAK28887.1 hypothetical protein K8O81_02455 [Prevotella nigrescens]WMS21992.1 hypothetical protein RDV52_11070 [Prevotella nigrescens]